MEITGIQVLTAPRQKVWDALNDPDTLKQCLPGCESVEKVGSDEFKVVMVSAIGPLRARFNGTLRMTDATPPSSCTMVFDGQGGAVGFGKGSSTVTLVEVAEGTELSYTAQAQIGGKLAQVGSRLIDSVARKMADDFFKAFKRHLAPPELPSQGAGTASQDLAVTPAPGSSHEAVTSAVAQRSPGGTIPAPSDRPASATRASNSEVMVPGWWLLVAVIAGSALTVAGALLVG